MSLPPRQQQLQRASRDGSATTAVINRYKAPGYGIEILDTIRRLFVVQPISETVIKQFEKNPDLAPIAEALQAVNAQLSDESFVNMLLTLPVAIMDGRSATEMYTMIVNMVLSVFTKAIENMTTLCKEQARPETCRAALVEAHALLSAYPRLITLYSTRMLALISVAGPSLVNVIPDLLTGNEGQRIVHLPTENVIVPPHEIVSAITNRGKTGELEE